jgi:DNA-directed RNA polymerase specialized sigma24 family protein
MTKAHTLTQEDFNGLLEWLGQDREQAADKYEAIRRRLIRIFISRGCHHAEELADETINRVTFKLKEIRPNYVGDPALYFYGVANKVHLEYVRKPASIMPPPPLDPPDETEQEYACLEKCMAQMPGKQRELVLQYYAEDKRAKIDHRKELAEELGIALNALRIRVHRIRCLLQECMQSCLEQKLAG